MSWDRPSYLPAAVAESPAAKYIWDEGDLRWVYSIPDGVDLQSATWAQWVDAAICGLTIATVQWVVFRLKPLNQNQIPQFAIEAAWCANIDPHYCRSLELNRREWTGPIRGPLLTCVNLMHEALFESPDAGTKPTHCPALAAQLVEHVCAEFRDAFEKWRSEVLDRLDPFYKAPDPITDLYGEKEARMLVPPQAFDPSIKFDLKNAPDFANEFLKSVDYRSNPFLVKPEQMLASGFQGMPYRYP